MTIQVGDRLPEVPLTIATSEGPRPTTTGEFFGGGTSTADLEDER